MPNLLFKKELEGHLFQVFDKKPNFEVVEVKQVHGKEIATSAQAQSNEVEADGIISGTSLPPLAIKTADCLPIVVLGKNGHALLHAGWRGVHQKIVQAKQLSSLGPYFFYIGPHIQLEDFIVKEDFLKNFPDSSHFLRSSGELRFHLASEVKDQIKSAYPSAQIEVCPLSTVTRPEFHSFRENATAQRNWNILSKIV